MKEYVLLDNKYEVIEDLNKCFNLSEVEELFTDYFKDYDYVLGDYSYGKLRLKGYYDKTNKKANKINNFEGIRDYIENYCSFNCDYFIIKKNKKC